MERHLRGADAPLEKGALLRAIWGPDAGRPAGRQIPHLEEERPAEPEDDTDVGLWPSQPSVAGSGPSRSSPSHAAKLVGGLR